MRTWRSSLWQTDKRTATTERRATPDGPRQVTRGRLIELLNEDLAREYQAIVAHVVYSRTLKGASAEHLR